MGQKTNPNSFHKNQISNNQNFQINTFVNSTEYNNLLKHSLFFSSNISSIFHKNYFFLKNCFFLTNSKQFSILLFLSFFLIYKKKTKIKVKKSQNKQLKKFKKLSAFIVEKIFKIFLNVGYFFKKRVVIQNLNKFNFSHLPLKNLDFLIEKYIGIFKKEIYYKSAISLIRIVLSSKNPTFLLGKYFSFYFKIFYKSKRKINKFFSFIRQYLKLFFNLKTSTLNISGIKIQIKGRFSGAPRSSSNIFQIGSIPLQSIIINVNYCFLPIFTKYGLFGVKIWIYI
jgi:hypothetical protein